ncbi:hypothetical protein GQ55_3G116600 [Panicum hallii var. hallii]|uniref:Uncharacterized protein n=1 Tax=Panicum hallii var. hallii TaxID=1504633 RepID=A0A2T7E8E4_9POAL|nr:hypothetical protein GQ55_3G116600 [Panicum hallii var. hallii]
MFWIGMLFLDLSQCHYTFAVRICSPGDRSMILLWTACNIPFFFPASEIKSQMLLGSRLTTILLYLLFRLISNFDLVWWSVLYFSEIKMQFFSFIESDSTPSIPTTNTKLDQQEPSNTPAREIASILVVVFLVVVHFSPC